MTRFLLSSKLNDWDDEDGFGPPSEAPETASSLALKARVVVLKHMFTLNDLEQDPTLILELKNDVREECETLGDVTNVVLYDLESEGVMTVKFRDSVSAQACILVSLSCSYHIQLKVLIVSCHFVEDERSIF